MNSILTAPDLAEIIPNLEEHVYHSEPGITSTQVRAAYKSILAWRFLIENPVKPTPAMQLGTAFPT